MTGCIGATRQDRRDQDQLAGSRIFGYYFAMSASTVPAISKEKEESIKQAVASLALEGLTVSPEALEDMRSDLSTDECVAKILARHGSL